MATIAAAVITHQLLPPPPRYNDTMAVSTVMEAGSAEGVLNVATASLVSTSGMSTAHPLNDNKIVSTIIGMEGATVLTKRDEEIVHGTRIRVPHGNARLQQQPEMADVSNAASPVIWPATARKTIVFGQTVEMRHQG